MPFYAYSSPPLAGRQVSYGAFGYAGQGIIADIGFDQPWSDDDWRKNVWGGWPAAYTANYNPLNSSVISQAQANWQAMQDNIDLNTSLKSQYQSLMNSYRSDIGRYASQVDVVTRGGDYGYGGGQSKLDNNNWRISNYNAINGKLQEIAAMNVPDASAQLDTDQQNADAKAAADAAKAAADAAAAKAAADKAKADQAAKAAADAAAVAKLHQTQDAIAQAQAALAQAQQAKAIADASAKKHQELRQLAIQKSAATAKTIPWIAGGVIALSAVAIFFARRGKSSHTAGYRRRRR